jgi:hypothetical protein
MLPGLTAAVSIPREQKRPEPPREDTPPPKRSPEVSLVEPAP